MTDRERLIELILNAPRTDVVYGDIKLPKPIQTAQTVADNLLANGVIVPPCKVGDKTFLLLERVCGGYDIVDSECVYIAENKYTKIYSMAFDCPEIDNTDIDNLAKEKVGETITQKTKDQTDFCGVPCNLAEELANTSRAKAIRDFVYELKQIPHIAVYKYEIDNVAERFLGDSND